MKLQGRGIDGQVYDYRVIAKIQITLDTSDLSWEEMKDWIEEILWDYPGAEMLQLQILREPSEEDEDLPA